MAKQAKAEKLQETRYCIHFVGPALIGICLFAAGRTSEARILWLAGHFAIRTSAGFGCEGPRE